MSDTQKSLREIFCPPCLTVAENPFSALSDLDFDELSAESALCSFKKREYLFRSGQPVQGIFCISSGVVTVGQFKASREITVRLASVGDWVGHRSVFTSDTYRGSAQVREAVRACFVPSHALLRLIGSRPEFAYLLVRLIARDLESTESLLLEHRELNVASRLISVFRMLDRKFGIPQKSGRILSITTTKVELAKMVGASHEVVSRQLSIWKKEGLLHEERKRIFLSHRFLSRVIKNPRTPR